jgi:hypothetical protein
MSQNDFTLANQSFPAFRADLNSALQALASNNSGGSAPTTTFANMWWYDSTNNIMYIRNEDNDAWIKFAELDQANDKFVLSGTLQLDDGTVSAPALTFNSDTNMGIYRGGTDILKFVTAGTDAVTIDASQNMTLAGTLNVESSTTPTINIKSTDAVVVADDIVGAITFEESDATGGTGVQAFIKAIANDSGNTYDMSIGVGGNTEAIRIDQSGDVTLAGSMTGTTVTLSTSDNNPQLTITSTDADANAGPEAVFDRNSSSPADADRIGKLTFKGRNDANQVVEYGNIQSRIIDASDGTEDGRIIIQNIIAGDVAGVMESNGTETIFNENSKDLDFRVESDGNANAFFVDAGNDVVGMGTSSPQSYANNQMSLTISDSTNPNLVFDDTGQARNWHIIAQGTGLNITYADSGGSSTATNVSNAISIRNDTVVDGIVINDDSKQRDFRIESDNNSTAFFVDASGDQVQFGTNITAVTKIWFDNLEANDTYAFFGNNTTTSTNSPMFINRHASDGQLIQFRQGNVQEGTISVSGNTVSYNGFSGRHESSGIPANTPVGTVVSTIDALDVYPDNTTDTQGNAITHPKAGQTRADHAKVEVSTSVGDPCVYGVVSEFDGDGKLIVTSVGIGSIRVTGACNKGDLLESNGDGTAKVQSDDIIRSKTIGKVTIGNNDASEKLVSCVMYCG